jgi:hypothetical protein
MCALPVRVRQFAGSRLGLLQKTSKETFVSAGPCQYLEAKHRKRVEEEAADNLVRENQVKWMILCEYEWFIGLSPQLACLTSGRVTINGVACMKYHFPLRCFDPLADLSMSIQITQGLRQDDRTVSSSFGAPRTKKCSCRTLANRQLSSPRWD